jgi:hypothetical protein
LFARHREILEFTKHITLTIDTNYVSALSPRSAAFNALTIILLCEKNEGVAARIPKLAESGLALATGLVPILFGCPKGADEGLIAGWTEKKATQSLAENG